MRQLLPTRYLQVRHHIILTALAFGMMLIASATCFTPQASAFTHRAYPGTLTITSIVGDTVTGYVDIVNDRDSSQPGPMDTVTLSVSGSHFTLLSPSQIGFFSFAAVYVSFSASAAGSYSGQLSIIGDSNTVNVSLVGNAYTHIPIDVPGSMQDSAWLHQRFCYDIQLYNPNSATMHLVNASFEATSDNGVAWHIESPSTPVAIGPHQTLTVTICDSGLTTGTHSIPLDLVFEYSDSTFDTKTIQLYATVFTTPNIDACVAIAGMPANPALSVGWVGEGSSATHTYQVYNKTSASVVIDSIVLSKLSWAPFDGRHSVFNTTLPMTLAAHDTADVTFKIQWESNPSDSASMVAFAIYAHDLASGMSCAPYTGALEDGLQIPIVDTITLNFPPGSDTLHITTTLGRSYHWLILHNTDANDYFIETMSIQDDAGALGMGYWVRDTLRAGSYSSGQFIYCRALTPGTFDGLLTITYRNAITSVTYPIVIDRLPSVTSSVRHLDAASAELFTLSPNPASQNVSIALSALVEDPARAQIEIYDVLGNRVAAIAATSAVTHWDGKSVNGNELADGSYIVRLSYRTSSGTIQSQSKRLIYVRK